MKTRFPKQKLVVDIVPINEALKWTDINLLEGVSEKPQITWSF